jgi:hypothetical protein
MAKCKATTKKEKRCTRDALPKRDYCWQHESKLFKGVSLFGILSLLTVITLGVISVLADSKELGFPIVVIKEGIKNETNPQLVDSVQSVISNISSTEIRVGKPTNDSISYYVYPNYDPSGYMGDIGDITVNKKSDRVEFTYETRGRSPHEWEYKYINQEINTDPAQFAGVMYVNPPNNWGTDPNGGYDLRKTRKKIKWEARSLSGVINIEFVIGGVVWKWDENEKKKVNAPYFDSMRRLSLGIKELSSDWQPFENDLSDIPEEEFSAVVGGFAWVISWGSNDVQLNDQRTLAAKSKSFVFEIRNIRYEN